MKNNDYSIPISCPLCFEHDSIITTKLNDSFVLNTDRLIEIEIATCHKCQFCFQSSAYKEKYDETIFESYKNYQSSKIFQFPERSSKNLVALEILEEEGLFRKDNKILEIGSNRGDLLYLIKEKYPNVNILGLEPSFFENLNVPTIRSSFDPSIFSCKFDLIILKHVFEHIKNPVKFLDQIKTILQPRGRLYIEVPDLIRSLDHFVDDFVPDHVSFFSKDTLLHMLRKSGFEGKVQNRYFLHALARISQSNTELSTQENFKKVKIDACIKTFKVQRDKLLENVSSHQNILFYGVSLYFRRLYFEIKHLAPNASFSFWDDNFSEDKESFSQIPRSKEFSNVDLIIICSNNWQIQQKILSKIRKNGVEASVLLPWSEINKIE
jgi:SAM-dependent methyltransferase